MYTYVIKKILKHPVIALTIILGPIVAVLFIIFFIIGVLTSEEGGSNNGCSPSGGGTYSANFKVTGNWVEKQALKWCASQQMSAAQAAAVLGSIQQESSGVNATGSANPSNHNWLGWSNSSGTNADHSHDSSDVGSYLSGFVKAEGGGQPDQWWEHPTGEPGAFKHFKSAYHNRSATDCEEMWGHHMEVCGDMGYRVKYANQFYKQIAHGSSTVSDVSDTASSSGSSCGSSDNSSDTDLISFAKKYLGIGYAEPQREVAQKISEGAPKSEVKQGTDCDEFDWACLKHCGYKVGANFGDCDGEMSALKSYQVSKNDTHPGSIGVYPVPGNLQHSFMLLEKYKGPSTKILSEGPPSKGVNICTLGWCESGGDFSTLKFYNVPKK